MATCFVPFFFFHSNCPFSYDIILDCTEHDPEERPPFDELALILVSAKDMDLFSFVSKIFLMSATALLFFLLIQCSLKVSDFQSFIFVFFFFLC